MTQDEISEIVTEAFDLIFCKYYGMYKPCPTLSELHDLITATKAKIVNDLSKEMGK